MIKLGTRVVETGSGVRRVNMRDIPANGSMFFKFLAGPVKREFQYYPTKRVDRETKVTVPSWNRVYVDQGQTPIDHLAAIDKQMQVIHNNNPEPRSRMDRQQIFEYYAIVEDKGQYELIIFESSWGLQRDIAKLEQEIGRDPNVLTHGLIWMFWTKISKEVTPGKAKEYGTKYSPTCPDSPVRNKIPVAALNDPSKLPGQETDYFTPEEITVIEKIDKEIEDIDIPKTPDKVIEAMLEFPFNIIATNKDNTPVFPHILEHKEEFIKLIEAKQLSYCEISDTSTEFNPKQIEQTPTPSAAKLPSKEITPEEVITEEKPQVPGLGVGLSSETPKKGRGRPKKEEPPAEMTQENVGLPAESSSDDDPDW